MYEGVAAGLSYELTGCFPFVEAFEDGAEEEAVGAAELLANL